MVRNAKILEKTVVDVVNIRKMEDVLPQPSLVWVMRARFLPRGPWL